MHVHHEALVVAMTLVPGLFSRNRAFDLFERPEVRRGRARASLLRGIVRQLVGTQGAIESLHISEREGRCELSYCLPGMKFQRRASLTELELACVRYLAGRAGVERLCATEADRTAIDATLRRLGADLRLSGLQAETDP